jgi:hypothetical protein
MEKHEEGQTIYAAMVKEKVLGMCVELMEAANHRLDALSHNAVVYKDFIIMK